MIKSLAYRKFNLIDLDLPCCYVPLYEHKQRREIKMTDTLKMFAAAVGYIVLIAALAILAAPYMGLI